MLFDAGNFALLAAADLAFVSPQGAMFAPYISSAIPFVARYPAARNPFAVLLIVGGIWWTAVESSRLQHERAVVLTACTSNGWAVEELTLVEFADLYRLSPSP